MNVTSYPTPERCPLDADCPELFEPDSLVRLAEGFEFLEGPIWHPSGCLYFSDIPVSRIYRWAPGDGVSVFRQPSENSNGMTLDGAGRLLICEQALRRVGRLEKGATVAVAERWEGRRLNSPNDVVMRGDGSVFFSDPPFFVKPEDREIEFQGVFGVTPEGIVRLVADDFNRPNGLAFSLDEKLLLVSDTADKLIRAFHRNEDGWYGGGEHFADMDAPGEPGAPDGMKFDSQGNVWCTGPGAVWIFGPSGDLRGKLRLPEVAANLSFGGVDRKDLFLTARSGLYRVRVKHTGAPLAGIR